jgi:hypothetical protein
MIRKTNMLLLSVAFGLALGQANTALAASVLSIESSGGGTYVVQGIGMESSAAMDITITYDAATLASPQFTQGDLISGAMVAVNDTIPGTVRIGIVRTTPVTGTGVIATLVFTPIGSSAGKILGIAASISNIDGKALPVIAQISQQSDTATADTSGTSASSTGESAATSLASAAPAGADVMPKLIGPSGSAENKSGSSAEQSAITGTAMESESASSEPTEMADTGGITAASEPSRNKIQQFDGVLMRFKKYSGERTAKAVIALFAQDDMVSYHQQPDVVLSDGKTPVRVTFISSSREITAADVAVLGARVVSVKKDPDYSNTWTAELIPEKNAYDASFAVSDGTLKRIYPLTIAPMIRLKTNKAGFMTEQDLTAYLSKQRQDVNNDGKKNYLDDYIYTANYLFNTKNVKHR